jgi:valyl-tRNA synthetase
MLKVTLEKAYEPKEVEKKWYSTWEDKGYFRARVEGDAPTYSMVIPPPNITGSLHMGHALNNTMQDILTRYHRMLGHRTLWMPGTDHAGIATQNVVERQLAENNLTRHQVGREKFVERVWEWREQSGGTIMHQLRKIGCSCDWSRERFTLDEGLSKAVREVFVRLYEEGLIYRGERLINWCPRCHTALSDLESPLEEEAGKLWHIKYPLEDGSGHLTVATTRPETMLGDTAVAVNPDDERYTDFIGKKVKLPLTDRLIPVIADEVVDVEFGTGALKITPAHDPADFETGQRHDLEMINILTTDGKINENGYAYEGLDRFDARRKVCEDLEEQGLLVKIDDHALSIPHCYRCHTIIEPFLSMQWFVKTKPLAEPAIEAVRSGRTRFVPENWTKTYYEWMNNIRDWCISRQIWWGHRIPAWYCDSCDEVIVARTDPDSCPKCGETELRRDEDVLDTWFSSALWPFSTMGWPDKTPELEIFYPTSVLITGFDIIFFWVARMMMMGLKFMDEVPFTDVYIHALVRDADGQKMSKSKGNVVDPLTMSDEYGTDAFRFTLAAMAAQGRDIRLDVKRIDGYRRFCNKLWNAARFALSYLNEDEKPSANDNLSLADRMILSKLAKVTAETKTAIDEYRFDAAANGLYQFVWHEFCDWYIELAKPALNSEDESVSAPAKSTLYLALETLLRLLHPIMPFITEEIWQKLPGTGESIMIADYPENDRFEIDEEAERTVDIARAAIVALRNIRAESNIKAGKRLVAYWRSDEPDSREAVTSIISYVLADREGRIESFESISEQDFALKLEEGAATAVAGPLTILVPFAGNIDMEEERKRLERELAKIEKDIATVNKKLSNEKFVAKAPAEVVTKEREKLNTLLSAKQTLDDSKSKLSV